MYKSFANKGIKYYDKKKTGILSGNSQQLNTVIENNSYDSILETTIRRRSNEKDIRVSNNLNSLPRPYLLATREHLLISWLDQLDNNNFHGCLVRSGKQAKFSVLIVSFSPKRHSYANDRGTACASFLQCYPRGERGSINYTIRSSLLMRITAVE